MKKPLLIALAALTLAGCGARPAAPDAPSPPVAATPTVPAPPEPVAPKIPDLAEVSSPYNLTVDELAAALPPYLAGKADLAAELGALYDRWGLKANADPVLKNLLYTEADLNGDGTPEVITTLIGKHPRGRGTEGALLVISRDGAAIRVDRSRGGGDPANGYPRQAVLLAVRDVTGDQKPDIVWAGPDHGAHTAYAHFSVSQWAPGQVTTLPGTLYISFPTIAFDGPDILLHGGGVGSAGAGTFQRSFTDRYHWNGTAFTRVDRRYDPSPYTYHRLQDGITAEGYGRVADALEAYRDAASRPPEGKLNANMNPELQEPYLQAVPAYARFRWGALLYQQRRADEAKAVLGEATGLFADLSKALLLAGNREAGCQAASAWAEAIPTFLEALNAPWGYANPHWDSQDLCGPLPPGR